MDGTYDHQSQSSIVAQATKEGPVWSYDLTAATDRLPLNIQSCVMEFLDKEIGEIWTKILKSMIFYYKGKGYKYTVGQPMGLYSSWASMAMTHHFIIQYCSYQLGRKSVFLKYSVLGDDVAIWDKQVAEKYENLISLLGVSISKSKSYVPGLTGPYKGEFAKRLFYDGEEISGISASVLNEGLKSYWNFPEMRTFLILHGLAEMERTPISRVVEVLKLKQPKEIEQLSCVFHVNEILGGPPITRDLLLDTIINDFSFITVRSLLQERFENLMVSISDIYTTYNGPPFYMVDEAEEVEEGNRKKLENLLGVNNESTPSNLIIRRVLRTRIIDIAGLATRMQELIQGIDEAHLFKKQKLDDPIIEYEENIITKLKDIEYIPMTNLESLQRGITLHEDKKVYRAKYLRNLVIGILSKCTRSKTSNV
jgi:hypothetical protein